MNVINLQPAAFDFGLESSEAVFPVSTRPIAALGRDGATLAIPSHKAVIRPDEDGGVRPLGVVGADYKLLKNVDFFGNLEDTMRSEISPDLLRGATAKTEVSYDGAFTRREYVLPAFKDELRTSNGFTTEVGFRIISWNSYDGSAACGMASGLIDFYCTNGMISGKLVDVSKRRHTSGLKADHFRGQLSTGIGRVQHEVRMLRKLAMTELDPQVATRLLEDNFSATRARKLMERVEVEANTRGWNVFALHSALTFYSSHNSDDFAVRQTGNDNVAKTLHTREAEVARIMPKVTALAA